jgi:hypothetical protein
MEFGASRVQWPSFVVVVLNPRVPLPESHLHFLFYLFINFCLFLLRYNFHFFQTP